MLSAASEPGADYVEAMRLAGEYVCAGRDWVCSHVAAIPGALILEEVHSHHNYSWREEHYGEPLWVPDAPWGDTKRLAWSTGRPVR